MSQEARLKRLGIDHLSPKEQMVWLEKRLAAGRQQEAEARAADQQRQAVQQQAEEETFIQQ